MKLFVFLFAFVFPIAAFGEDIVVYEKTELAFHPTRVTLLLWSEDRAVEALPATFIQGENLNEGRSANLQRWYVAGIIPESKNARGVASLFYIEGADESVVTPQQFVKVDSENHDSQQLMRLTVTLNQELWELQNATRHTESELRTLKEEIGVVGDLEQIMKLRFEQKRYQALLESVQQEENALKDSLVVLKDASKPIQYERRESELMRANSEMGTKVIPFRKEMRRVERQREKDVEELEKLEKKYAKLSIPDLEKQLIALKQRSFVVTDSVKEKKAK